MLWCLPVTPRMAPRIDVRATCAGKADHADLAGQYQGAVRQAMSMPSTSRITYVLKSPNRDRLGSRRHDRHVVVDRDRVALQPLHQVSATLDQLGWEAGRVLQLCDAAQSLLVHHPAAGRAQGGGFIHGEDQILEVLIGHGHRLADGADPAHAGGAHDADRLLAVVRVSRHRGALPMASFLLVMRPIREAIRCSTNPGKLAPASCHSSNGMRIILLVVR